MRLSSVASLRRIFVPWCRWLFAVLLAILALSASNLLYARVPNVVTQLRPQDEIWLVSTREMGVYPRAAMLACPQFTYRRYCCQSGWQDVAADRSPCCTDTNTRTVIYVHGNRMTSEWVQRRALDFYNGLIGHADDRPIRLIVWSWPSSPIPCRFAFARDARVKYRRTTLQSYYLARWIHRHCRDSHFGMVGYSYGARTILGALQLLAGGQLSGRCLPESGCGTPHVHVALWAAASQSDWLLNGKPHGRAMDCIESAAIFYNRVDPALKRYSRVLCKANGPALGHVGLTRPHGGPAGYSRICQIDVTKIVGRHHDWNRYCGSCSIMAQTSVTALESQTPPHVNASDNASAAAFAGWPIAMLLPR